MLKKYLIWLKRKTISRKKQVNIIYLDEEDKELLRSPIDGNIINDNTKCIKGINPEDI